jgi:hypothetical protein
MPHIQPIGEFELHRYGIDISLGNEANDYGGILIRGLWDFTKEAVIKKSEVVRSLFNNLMIGDNKIELVTKSNPWLKVFKSTRINLGSPDTDSDRNVYHSALYKYMPADKAIMSKYPDKERILLNSDLSPAEISQLIGYNLNRVNFHSS